MCIVIKKIIQSCNLVKPYIAYKMVRKYGDNIYGPFTMAISKDNSAIGQFYVANQNNVVKSECAKLDIRNYATDSRGNINKIIVDGGLFYFYKEFPKYYYDKNDFVILKCQLLDTIYLPDDNDEPTVGASAFKILEEIKLDKYINNFNVGDKVKINFESSSSFYTKYKEYKDKELVITYKYTVSGSPQPGVEGHNIYKINDIDNFFDEAIFDTAVWTRKKISDPILEKHPDILNSVVVDLLHGEDHKHPLFYYVPDTDSLKIESVYPFDVDGEDYTDDEPDEDKEKCKGYVAEPRTSSDY